ncbi:unnamed protein product [Ectocarpus sp. CCAP 1310/34]|nr:unnamed protein product [Ectocarpus sp. CCAP 1310/34]
MLLADLNSAKIFSTLDLISGFFQCCIEEDSIPITAVITATGLYEFKAMPQGLSSSPGWFHSVMQRVCDGLERVRLFIDDVIVYSRNGAEHVQDLERFFERMTKFNLKLAPKKAQLGVKVVTFLGHQVTAEGIEPCPKKVKPMLQMPMPTNVSQLRSILGSLSYYRKFLKGMSAKLHSVTALLKKDAKFAFTAKHAEVIQEMKDKLSSPEVLAFPDYEGAITGKRKFRLITDASISGLGAVIEQEQEDGTVRPLCYLSRSTYPNERRWSATELECGAIVWAIKKNRTLFYGIPFQIYSDHQPLRNLESLAEKNNRVQRWFDFLSAYTYELIYRPGKANGNADCMSRLPLPPMEEDASPEMRLTDPSDLDVYMIGASGVIPARMGPVLGGRKRPTQADPRKNFVLGEDDHQPFTTDEEADRTWQVIQQHRETMALRVEDEPKHCALKDETPLVDPGKMVVSGQWESGLILHAVPMTEVGRCLLGMGVIKKQRDKRKRVMVINSNEGGGSAGGGSEAEPVMRSQGSQLEGWNSKEAKEFGERLCEKTASDWVEAQYKDLTAKAALQLITDEVEVHKIVKNDIPEGVDIDDIKRLVAQGTIIVLADSRKLLVRRATREPSNRPNRNPGQFDRLLGDEPVRTYVPLMLRPWVMDCAHKEAVHLGEKVTLSILQRLHWWVGMAESVRW